MEGRIIKALAGYYYVLDNEERIWSCRARGVFKKQGIQPLVGDVVQFEQVSNQDGWITNISPRKNSLQRPPIANIDQALLVHAVTEPSFNPLLLDRMLVVVEHIGIVPLLCFTKADLLEDWQWIKQQFNIYQELGYQMVLTSAVSGLGIDKLRRALEGKITVLAGPSGAGKSTLLNKICPHVTLETGAVSKKLGRGKHTTRHVELLKLSPSGLVADTPGFSQLDFTNITEDTLGSTFPEIRRLEQDCKYRGCLHRSEPGCAVKEALSQHQISTQRYEHYLQFLNEIETSRDRKR
jgi:ribosome biogenesis GTPase